MPASTTQPKRVWGPPAAFHPDPTSPGKTPAPPNGKFIFVRSPSETWSTDTLENYVATLHARITNGANPALVAPSINSANAILENRRAPKDHGEARSVENGADPKP